MGKLFIGFIGFRVLGFRVGVWGLKSWCLGILWF